MKRFAVLALTAGALLLAAPLCVQATDTIPTPASLDDAYQAIFAEKTPTAPALPETTPAPELKAIPNCGPYCQQHGQICRNTGGRCQAIFDDVSGTWYCGCYYP